MGALLVAQTKQAPKTGLGMVGAAKMFLSAITPEQSKEASFKYDDPERLNWHFIPRPRKGLPLKSLEGASLQAAHKLIRSGLSEAGYDQTLNVMSLEEVLYLIEPGDRAERRDRRDPGKYYISIFGTPAETGLGARRRASPVFEFQCQGWQCDCQYSRILRSESWHQSWAKDVRSACWVRGRYCPSDSETLHSGTAEDVLGQ